MSIEKNQDENNVPLAVATYYIAAYGVDQSRVSAIHLKWDATLVATITLEESNFPDAALNSVVAGDWIAVAGATAAPAAAAGGTMLNVLDRGAKKFRLKAVVSTAGVLRMRTHGKQ